MKIYYIHTFAHENKSDMVIGYTYRQYKEVIEMLKANNIPYTTWCETINFQPI